jgi:hypothetical protein
MKVSKPHTKPTAKQLIGLGVCKARHAYELLDGRKKPSLSMAVEIEKHTGYPPRAWLSDSST